MGRDGWRRGEVGLEAAYPVPFDQPDAIAPGGVLGDQALRLGRVFGPGEGSVLVDCERAVELLFQATVVGDGRVAEAGEVGGVAVDDVDPGEGTGP